MGGRERRRELTGKEESMQGIVISKSVMMASDDDNNDMCAGNACKGAVTCDMSEGKGDEINRRR